MNATPDIVMQLRDILRQGSKAEKRLAEVILSDMAFASRAPVAEIAKKAGTSQPSVTRLCRLLGLEGTRDFKLKLAQALVIGEAYLSPPVLNRSSAQERIITDVCEGAIQAVIAVRQTVRMDPIMRAAEWLASARQVYIYGSGGISSLGAVELQNRLFRFSIPVITHTDGQMQQMSAAVSDSGTVVVGMSSSGGAPSVIAAIEIANRYGARTIAITPEGSTLGRAADMTVDFQSAEDELLTKPTSARYALLVIVDLIAMATAENFDEAVFEKLRRVRLTLSDLQTGSRKWPIGD